MKPNQTKDFDLRQAYSVVYQLREWARRRERTCAGPKLRILLLLLLIASDLLAQDRKVDATWLHRYLPRVAEAGGDQASGTCHYKPVFGEGDTDNRILRSVTRFTEVTLDAHANCQSALFDREYDREYDREHDREHDREYAREEEIYFVLEGNGVLHYGADTYAMRTNDFTYLPPGMKHSIGNSSEHALRVLVMGFKIPAGRSIAAPSPHPKIVNLDDVKEETVDGHPTSVLYKLLLGPRTGKRDAIDEAYVVTSFFWMKFAPGGTNFPHHHETAEEIYLVLDGQGEMAAGSGLDGVEGRYPAKAGDAYYFRPNCTVGFYNQNKPGANAYILAVRSQIPLPEEAD
jgi:mannose-6-phosphate isomerase-like protein (cupin superfamily)